MPYPPAIAGYLHVLSLAKDMAADEGLSCLLTHIGYFAMTVEDALAGDLLA